MHRSKHFTSSNKPLDVGLWRTFFVCIGPFAWPNMLGWAPAWLLSQGILIIAPLPQL